MALRSMQASHAVAGCVLQVLALKGCVLCHCRLPLVGEGRYAGQQVCLRGQQGTDLRLELGLGGSQGLNLRQERAGQGQRRTKQDRHNTPSVRYVLLW